MHGTVPFKIYFPHSVLMLITSLSVRYLLLHGYVLTYSVPGLYDYCHMDSKYGTVGTGTNSNRPTLASTTISLGYEYHVL